MINVPEKLEVYYKPLIFIILILFLPLFYIKNQYFMDILTLCLLIVFLRSDDLVKLVLKKDSVEASFAERVNTEKTRGELEENKQEVTPEKLVFYKDLENSIMRRLGKEIGGDLKKNIRFVYGNPDKPEFLYVPDGIIKKDNDLTFVEIRHVIDKRVADQTIENGIQALQMVLKRFQPYSAKDGTIKAMLVIASPHDLSGTYKKQYGDVELRFLLV
jgi:hypothetical protein